MQTFPFALRLIGFSAHEVDVFQAYFELEKERQPAYFCLLEDSLQEPDLFLVNGENLKALATLSGLNTGPARPALLVGKPVIEVAWPYVAKPLAWDALFQHLAILIGARADALSRLAAAELVAVPDRRRQPRIDFDLTDQSEYIKMRRPAAHGGVLLVDKNPAFCLQLNELLMRYHLAVDWVNSREDVLNYCRDNPIAVVMLNTSLEGIEPYALCSEIKQQAAGRRVAVIFLVGKSFDYDSDTARQAGADGMLDKPLSVNQVVLALKKFIPMGR